MPVCFSLILRIILQSVNKQITSYYSEYFKFPQKYSFFFLNIRGKLCQKKILDQIWLQLNSYILFYPDEAKQSKDKDWKDCALDSPERKFLCSVCTVCTACRELRARGQSKRRWWAICNKYHHQRQIDSAYVDTNSGSLS